MNENDDITNAGPGAPGDQSGSSAPVDGPTLVVPPDEDGSEGEEVVTPPAPAPGGRGYDYTFGGRPLFYMSLSGLKSVGAPMPYRGKEAPSPGRDVLPMLGGHQGWLNSDGTFGPVETFGILREDVEPVLLGSATSGQKGELVAATLPGTYVLTGSSGSGKTVLAGQIYAESTRTRRVDGPPETAKLVALYSIGEPVASVRHAATANSYAGVLNVVARCNPGSVIVVDSISAIAVAGGNLQKGGISRDVFSYIELLTSAAESSGSFVFVILNILSNDPDAASAMREGLRGTATGVIVTHEVTERLSANGRVNALSLGSTAERQSKLFHTVSADVVMRPSRGEGARFERRIYFNERPKAYLPSTWDELITTPARHFRQPR